MKFANNRQMRIFYTLIETDHPVTSSTLSDITKASVRTIKKDISEIREIVKKDELEVVSKSGTGYYITCSDQKHLESIRLEILQTYRSLNVIPTEFLQKVNYIIRRLLSAGEYIKLDDLADELYLSKQALTREMREARSMLAQYYIQIVSKPNYGIRIEAEEYDYRLCMVDYFEFFYHRMAPFYAEEHFLDMFDFDFQERLQIRKVLLEAFREFHIIVPDFCSQKIVIHLLFANTRLKGQHFLHFSEKEYEMIEALLAYGQAEKVLKRLLIIPGFENFTKAETAYLALLIATGRDYLDEPYESASYGKFGQRAESLYAGLLLLFRQNYGFDPEEYPCFQGDMLHFLAILGVKLQFHIQDIQSSPATISHIGRTVLESPLVMELTAIAAEFLEGETGQCLCEYDLLGISNILYCMVESFPLTYKQANFIVAPETGKVAVRSVVSKLKEYFGSHVGKIDIFETYQLRTVDMSAYDARLTAHRIPRNEFSIPLYHIDYFINSEDVKHMAEGVFLGKYRFWDQLPKIKEENIYKNYVVDSIETFLHMIAYKYEKGWKEQELFYHRHAELPGKVKKHFRTQVMVICLADPSRKEGVFELFHFQKPLLLNDNPIKYAVLLSVNSGCSELLKATEIAARCLEREEEHVRRLAENPEYPIYTHIFAENIRWR